MDPLGFELKKHMSLIKAMHVTAASTYMEIMLVVLAQG
jgi:hypothetical protein